MSKNDSVQKFWKDFCDENLQVKFDETFQFWFFGNTREMARELAGLVISGKKTATASLAEVNKIKPEDEPIDNGYSIVTDFDANPMCIIQTTEIRHLPFDEVDSQFAFDEGEGDQSLEFWRKAHRDYFANEANEWGIKFYEKSLVCCERFKLLFPR